MKEKRWIHNDYTVFTEDGQNVVCWTANNIQTRTELARKRARLLAAAPELLEALERCVPDWFNDEDYKDDPDGASCCEISFGDVRAMRAAIAKATAPATP